jgi:hypothetical protein
MISRLARFATTATNLFLDGVACAETHAFQVGDTAAFRGRCLSDTLRLGKIHAILTDEVELREISSSEPLGL